MVWNSKPQTDRLRRKREFETTWLCCAVRVQSRGDILLLPVLDSYTFIAALWSILALRRRELGLIAAAIPSCR
jgi:hypothetical protein